MEVPIQVPLWGNPDTDDSLEDGVRTPARGDALDSHHQTGQPGRNDLGTLARQGLSENPHLIHDNAYEYTLDLD